MTDHAPARRDVFDVDEAKALEVLRLAWGDLFDIGHENRLWVATSRDGERRTFTGDTPDTLNIAIRADFALRETQ